MANVSRRSTITVSIALGTRTWEAIAVVQDTPAGDVVTVNYTQSVTGTAPPDPADAEWSLNIHVDDTATNLRTINIPVDGVSGSVTFSMTANAEPGGVARAGTLRMRMVVRRTGTPAFTINSDNATGETLPPGWSITARDTGWVRGTTTGTLVVSQAQGGSAPASLAYRDRPWARLTTVAPLYVSRTATLGLRDAGGGTTRLTGTSAAASTQTWEAQMSTPVKQPAFAAAVQSVEAFVTMANAVVSGLPAAVLASATAPALNADPRVAFTRHLQVNTNVYATPPGSKNVAPNRRAAELGFVSVRVTNARGEGVNLTGATTPRSGLSYSFVDTGNLTSSATTLNQSMLTQGGEDGWGPLLPWSEQLPSGSWTNTVTLHDSGDIQKTEGVLYTLIASDPVVTLMVSGGTYGGSQEDHFVAGDSFIAGMALVNTSTGAAMVPDAGASQVALCRTNLATGRLQHLSAAFAWVNTEAATPVAWHVCAPSEFDPAFLMKIFTGTSGWEPYDIFVLGRSAFNLSPFNSFAIAPVVGSKNRHSKYAFDVLGLK